MIEIAMKDDDIGIRELLGISPTFQWKQGLKSVGRLAGSQPTKLDMLGLEGEKNFTVETLKDYNNGDLLFEGRHGNSIRLGYHSSKPHIIISNRRGENQDVENIYLGVLALNLTNAGQYDSIDNLFRYGVLKEEEDYSSKILRSLLSNCMHAANTAIKLSLRGNLNEK